MTAQNITYEDFTIGSTPQLIISGTGTFKVELLSQSPAAHPLHNPPFSSIGQQNSGFVQWVFLSGLWVGTTDSIAATPLADAVYTPTQGQPGWPNGAPSPGSFTFPQGGSTPSADARDLAFFGTRFEAPVKLWAVNKNPLTDVSVRVWNWF